MKQEKFLNALQGNTDEKIDLYVTGGGPNSAFTAGMLAAIAAEGWTDNFRYYIGQSSGSFSLMFLLGGATVEGASAYWRALARDIANGRLINPWRLFNPLRPVLDLDYLVDSMFDNDPRIPWQKVLEHRVNQEGRLIIQVLDVHTGGPLFLSHFTTVRALRTAIKVSSWLPLLAGLRPCCVDKDVLTEMTVSDKDDNVLHRDTLYTYDGQLTNSFFGDIYRARPDNLHLVLTNIAKDARDRLTNPFGPRLLRLEWFLSWVLFWPWKNAVKAYQKSMLENGQRQDFDQLELETLDEQTNILGVFPSKNVSKKSLKDALSMHEAVYAGWCGLYTSLGITAQKDVGMLDEWDAALNESHRIQ